MICGFISNIYFIHIYRAFFVFLFSFIWLNLWFQFSLYIVRHTIYIVNDRIAAIATQLSPQKWVVSVSEDSPERAFKMWLLSLDYLEMIWYPWSTPTSRSLSLFCHYSKNGQDQAWKVFIKPSFPVCWGHISLAMGL